MKNQDDQNEEREGPRVKISISVAPETLARIDEWRSSPGGGGLNRSALFALAADRYMLAHPIKGWRSE
ncbi:hypothetical protein AB4Y36_38275 [Paraburkholderia sp. BR10936]|uniref:hypothetical protein n=1 Tax=Paraburkholderia sp. BR10936 TaxID=3236993 RepID=UPI0034D2F087